MTGQSVHIVYKGSRYLAGIFCLVLFMPSHQVNAQPYIDLMNVAYFNSPDIGKLGKDKNPTRLDYFNISATIPLQFRNKQDALILSPFFERWTSQVQSVSNYNEYHYGAVLPFTLLKTLPHTKWSMLTTVIVRMNDADINRDGQCQIGGALVAARQVNSNLLYKIGFYLNSEFFGLFFVPLVGIDWRINSRANLFGVLPASLTFEYRLAKRLYTGAVCRTFTNSYHDAGPNYWRIDENQLGVYLDYYPTKRILLNAELGHSVLRKIRSGTWHQINNSWNADNNMYFKFALAYRFRIRN